MNTIYRSIINSFIHVYEQNILIFWFSNCNWNKVSCKKMSLIYFTSWTWIKIDRCDYFAIRLKCYEILKNLRRGFSFFGGVSDVLKLILATEANKEGEEIYPRGWRFIVPLHL